MSAHPHFQNDPPLTQGEIKTFYASVAPEVPQNGREWRGPCPIHKGKGTNFSVNSETGRATCFSKCGGKGWDVFSLYQEIHGGRFPDVKRGVFNIIGRPTQQPSKLRQLPRVSRKITREHNYTGPDGELIFQSVRIEPGYDGKERSFFQRRPNGKGGWIDNIDGIVKVPYQLMQLINARIGVLTEGESDAITATIAEQGIIGTTNAGGAGGFGEQESEYLTDMDIVLVGDNDDTGHKRIERLKTTLPKYVRRLRELIVPAPFKDLTEWVKSGISKEALAHAIEDAPVVQETCEVAETERDWTLELLRTEKGRPYSNLANAITAFRHSPEWRDVLAHDDFALTTVTRKSTPWGSKPSVWTDQGDRLAANWLQHLGINVGVEIAGQAIQSVARENTIHPVRSFLDSLDWDRKPRIDDWIVAYLGAADSEYVRAVGAAWLVSGVARIYRPGAKVDSCLILEGPQGIGKSRSLKVLGGEFFSDDLAELGTKDSALQTAGVWILEISELDSMSRGDVGRIKAFLSRSVDRFRPPYGKHVIEAPRQCIFAGTSNQTEYLRDESGARRFWPIRCGRIDISLMERDRDQLWAEAVVRYRSGAKWWLDSVELIEQANAEQQQRYESDAWDSAIADFLKSRVSVSIDEILENCLTKPKGQWNQQDKNRVARSLRTHNWERYRVRRDSVLRWEYRHAG